MSHYTRQEIIKMLAAGSTLLLAGCTSRMSREELEVVASPTDVPPFNASSPTPLAPSPTHRGQPQGIAPTLTPSPTHRGQPQGIAPTAASASWQPPTEPRITPNEAFYIMKYNSSPPPEVDLSDYRSQMRFQNQDWQPYRWGTD